MRITQWRLVALLVVLVVCLGLGACAASIGGAPVVITPADIAAVIAAGKAKPAPVVPPAKVDPPVVVPSVVAPVDPPVVAPAPPAALPLQNLNIVVHDAKTGAGLNGAACIVNGDRRLADGSGFLNFAVTGPALVLCSAAGYLPAPVLELGPGDRRFPLISSAPPAPVIPAGVVPACGADNNTGRISPECLEAVAAGSADYRACKVTGAAEFCHAYVRAVARALVASQDDPRWGLIAKTQGGSNVEGYGEDVIAYLPRRFDLAAKTWQWNGLDIIGGLGLPGAHYNAGPLHGAIACDTPEATADQWCNRASDLWAPVPK